MLLKSRTICLSRRRPTSLGFSSPRCSMVRERHPSLRVRLSMLSPLIRFISGILVVLFFQCMIVLFNPANRRREGTKWGLVSYTVIMFLFATVLTAMGLNLGSISFIDNREYPGVEGEGGVAPGPLGYQVLIHPTALSVVPSVMFLLNYWLADGLLVSSLTNSALARSGV
jgi:hypothetical protein